MSYISFDYKCSDCGAIDARFVKRTEMDNQRCSCSYIQPLMTRLSPATRTTFRFADTKLKV